MGIVNKSFLAKDYVAVSPYNKVYVFTCAKDWIKENGMSLSVFNLYLDKGIIPETSEYCKKGKDVRKRMEFWQFYHRENYFGKLPEPETTSESEIQNDS